MLKISLYSHSSGEIRSV